MSYMLVVDAHKSVRWIHKSGLSLEPLTANEKPDDYAVCVFEAYATRGYQACPAVKP